MPVEKDEKDEKRYVIVENRNVNKIKQLNKTNVCDCNKKKKSCLNLTHLHQECEANGEINNQREKEKKKK